MCGVGVVWYCVSHYMICIKNNDTFYEFVICGGLGIL